MSKQLLLALALLAATATTGDAAPAPTQAEAAEQAHAIRHRYSVYYRRPGSGDWLYGGGFHHLAAAEDRAAELADRGYETRIHRHRR
jgi:hypothetical protein